MTKIANFIFYRNTLPFLRLFIKKTQKPHTHREMRHAAFILSFDFWIFLREFFHKGNEAFHAIEGHSVVNCGTHSAD